MWSSPAILCRARAYLPAGLTRPRTSMWFRVLPETWGEGEANGVRLASSRSPCRGPATVRVHAGLRAKN